MKAGLLAALALALSPAAGVAKTHVVVADSASFKPKVLEVRAGDTVEWKNEDIFVHNVHAADKSFGSKDLEPKRTFRWKATRVGRHAYACTIHPMMTGTLIVLDRAR